MVGTALTHCEGKRRIKLGKYKTTNDHTNNAATALYSVIQWSHLSVKNQFSMIGDLIFHCYFIYNGLWKNVWTYITIAVTSENVWNGLHWTASTAMYDLFVFLVFAYLKALYELNILDFRHHKERVGRCWKVCTVWDPQSSFWLHLHLFPDQISFGSVFPLSLIEFRNL